MSSLRKVAIITGSNSGIGLNAAKKLVERDIYTIIASRTESTVNSSVKKIKEETGRDNVTGMVVDLSDLQSVRKFVNDFNAKGLPLHILVNNAASSNLHKIKTKDGIDGTFAANHLGHFLLTTLLLDKIKASAPSRIVNVTSGLHDTAILEAHSKGFGDKVVMPNMDNFNDDNLPYNFGAMYSFTKLCNVWFTYELQRRLKGTGVTVNCMNPGFIPTTGLGRDFPQEMKDQMVKGVPKEMHLSLDFGGNEIVDLATNEDITEGGKYYSEGKLAESSKDSHDPAKQQKLWKLSEELVKKYGN